jgi:hypothetical protein
MADTLRQDLCLPKGSSKTYRLTIYNEQTDPSLDPELLDLTGSTLYFTVKNSALTTQLFQKVSTSSTQIEILPQTGATLGQADVKIGPSDTSSATAATYTYDIWIVLSSGKRYQIVPNSPFVLSTPVTVIP